MRRILALVALLAVGCATSGATEATLAASTQKDKQGLLTVQVNSSGLPLAGAVVGVGGQTKTTGATGRVTFLLTLRQEYTVTVSASGYQPWSSYLWFQKVQTVTATMVAIVVAPAAVSIQPGVPVLKGGQP